MKKHDYYVSAFPNAGSQVTGTFGGGFRAVMTCVVVSACSASLRIEVLARVYEAMLSSQGAHYHLG